MEAQLLEGKKVAEKLKVEVTREVERYSKKTGSAPTLRAIQLGEDPASELYLKSQKRAAESVGAKHEITSLAASATEQDLIGEIERANRDPKVQGIIVQMPLPEHINSRKVREAILPEKDVEGMNSSNLGKIVFQSGPTKIYQLNI